MGTREDKQKWLNPNRQSRALALRYQASAPSEELFDTATSESGLDSIDRAVQFFIRARQSRQGLMRDFATLSRTRTRGRRNEQANAWLSAVDGLAEIHERLSGVVILNRDALDVICQQDGTQTLFYCDPPYLSETRTAKNCYEYEMSFDQHVELLKTLVAVKGKVIVSGYPSKLYDGLVSKYGWSRADVEIDNKASSAKSKERKTECLWCNWEVE